MVRRLIKGQDGKLVEESTIAGTQPAPLLTNPLTAQTGGASPDAAKMAGTKANKESTIRKQIKSGDTLRRYRQTEDQRLQKKLGTADAQYVQTIQSVSNLPTFQKNIQAAAMEYAFGRGKDQTVSFTVKQDAVATQAAQAGLSVEELNLAINSILANPGAENLDAWNKVAKAVGKSPSDLTWDDFSMFVPQVEDIIEDTATPIFGANVRLSELPDLDSRLQQSGFKDLDDLANTLGTTPDAIEGMTLDQLNNLMLSLKPSFDTVADLRRKVNDPAIGANERTEIRKRLRELGITGVRSLEAKANQILEQVEDGDTIDFMGEQMRIEDLLSDDYMSGLISEALNSEETFRKLPPALQNYIASNREALEAATANIKGGLIARKQIIEDNRNLGAGIQDAIMDILVPGWNDATGGRIDVATLPPAYQTVKELDPGKEQAAFLSLLRDPRWKDYAKDFTVEDLRDIGFFDDPEGTFTALATVDDTIDTFTNEALTSDQIRTWMHTNLGFDPEQLRTLVKLGDLDPESKQLLDANSDGLLDSMQDIKDRIVGMFSVAEDPASMKANKSTLDALRKAGEELTLTQRLKVAKAEQLQSDTASTFGKGSILELSVDDVYDNPKWTESNYLRAILDDPYVPEVVKAHVNALRDAVRTSANTFRDLDKFSKSIGSIILDIRNYDDQRGFVPLLDKKQELMRVLANPMVSSKVKDRARQAVDLINSVNVSYQGDSKGGWYDVFVGGTRVMRFHPSRAVILTNPQGGEARTFKPDPGGIEADYRAKQLSKDFALGRIKV